MLKSVIWMGSSKGDLLAFPYDARRDAGHQLYLVQCGKEPSDWKPMTSIGAGVCEIRVHEAEGAFRVIYLATRPDGVYVLHCFQKKTRKTSKSDVELARGRFTKIPKKRGKQ